MGILDNEFAKLLFSGSPYMQSREREAVAQRQGEAFSGLLDQYRVPGDPNTPNPGPFALGTQEMNQAQLQQQGGFRGQGGLLSGGPPPDFYLRAAALPGYQQLAGQAQVGQQAMERQQQAQVWESQNMTLAQKTSADAQAQRDKWDQDRFNMGWNKAAGMTNAEYGNQQISRGQLGIAQGGLNLRQQEFNANYLPDPNRPGGFMPRPQQAQAPSGYQWAPDGTLAAIPGGPATKPSAEQEKAKAGLQTMLPSLELINQDKGNMGYTEAALGSIPGVGPTLAKWSQSGAEGRQRAAEGVFAANYIHAMSGAAASEAEVKRLTDSIFARPGDGAEAKEQKQANRNAIMQGQNILSGSKDATSKGPGSKTVDWSQLK